MACCILDASESCCFGGSCGVDEEVLFKHKQRQKLLESVRKLKGLSRNTRSQLSLDPLAVVEEARARVNAHRTALCCFNKSSAGTCPLFLWLCVYGAALASMHMKFLDFEKVLPPTVMPILDSEVFTDFNKIFSVGVMAMMVVMSLAYLLATLRMTAEIVGAAQDELRLDVCESIDHDFYSFVRRLRDNFVTCDDFTVAAIRKAHRRLHSLLKARIALVDIHIHGPLAIRREIDARVGPAQCCMLFFLFFVPWAVTMWCNLAQLLVAHNSPVAPPVHLPGPPDPIIPADPVGLPNEAVPLNVQTEMNDEGISMIATSLLINFLAAAYLAIAQSRCVEQCFVTCVYPRIHSAVLDYCNRLVCRTWEESVVEELVEFLEEPRIGFDKNSSTDVSAFQSAEDCQELSKTNFGTSQEQRLLTTDSCGPCPTPHQAALQAPVAAPRGKRRSQCLSLEPFTMSGDEESSPGCLHGVEGQYVELEDLDVPLFDDARLWGYAPECEEQRHAGERNRRSNSKPEQESGKKVRMDFTPSPETTNADPIDSPGEKTTDGGVAKLPARATRTRSN